MSKKFTILRGEFGFSVFPLTETKRPAVSWKRYQGQRCTGDEMRQWLKVYNRFGIATGRLSNIVVVDLDSPEALRWAEESLPLTPWVVLTGNRGDGFRGQHWYYRYPSQGNEARNTVRVNVEGKELALDIRGEGGYVVAPGSMHETGVVYEQSQTWLPTDEVPQFDPAWFPIKPVPSAVPRETLTVSQAELEQRFGNWLAVKESPPVGRRNHETYKASCAGYDFGLPEGVVFNLVWEWNKSNHSPLDHKEVLETVKSAKKSKQPPQNPKGTIAKKEPPTERASSLSTTQEPAVRGEEPAEDIPPEERGPTPPSHRTYTERSYVWASLGDKPTAQILAGFGEKRWRDRESRDAAAALKAVLARDEEPTQYNLSQELAAAGKFATFETLLEFCAKWITDDLHPSEAYRAFRDACDWDDFGAMLTAEVAQLNQGTCNKATSRLLDKVSAFVGTAKAVQKPKTLKQVVLDRLDEIESEDPDGKNIRLRLVDKYTGPFGGGDAVYACGPPKTGKTGLLMQMLRDAAQDGYTSLLGQLELREQQIADREGSYILGKPLTAFTAAERKYLRESNALANHERILVTPKFTDLEAYRSYVTMAFAQNKDIRIWATDYSEMVQDFGTKADQLAQTEAVSDFVKKTATAFDVLGILFTQPKEEYFKDCVHENRPRLTHWKRGRKYQQDAQALFFLHNPHEFDKNKPDNYLELYLQLCRSAPPAMIPLMVERSSFIYTEWKGELPGGGGSTGSGKNHGGGQHAGRPIDIAAKIRQQAKSMSFEDLDGTPDIDLSGILGV